MESAKPGAKVKLLVIGGLVGLIIGVGVTVFYFALAEFFRVQARAASSAASETAKKTQESRSPRAKTKAAG